MVWKWCVRRAPKALASSIADRPTPPAITPATSGALIWVGGVGAAEVSAPLTAAYLESSVGSNANVGTSANVAILAGVVPWTSGTYSPAQFGGGEFVSGNTSVGATIAFRPA